MLLVPCFSMAPVGDIAGIHCQGDRGIGCRVHQGCGISEGLLCGLKGNMPGGAYKRVFGLLDRVS